MPNYTYKGINNQGKKISGVIDADGEKAARIKLRKIGVFPTEVYVEGSGGGLSRDINFSQYLQKISVKDMAQMTRQMSTLLSAHIPLVDTLSALVEQIQNPKLKSVLGTIKESVVQGGRLSDAVAAHPKVFSNIYISMVAAGEASGALDVVLERLAELTEKQAALKSKVSGAMIYPGIMFGVSMLLMGFLMIFVVPKVTKIFEDQKVALPIATKILMFISHTLADYWYLVILGGVLLFLAFKKYISKPKGRRVFDKLQLRLPVVSDLLKKVAIARFSRTLSTMLGSGVQLLKAMDIVKNVMDNVILVEVIENTKVSVREGESVAEPLKRSGLFPPLVIHMIAIGEKTGGLESMLLRVADTYDTEVDNAVTTMTSVLEPMMIVLMGGMVGFIVMAILIPILQLSSLGT